MLVKRLTSWSAVAAFLTALGFSSVAMAADAPSAAPQHKAVKKSAKHKVVFQVSDPDPKKWNLALNNVNNVQQALGKNNVTVEVVVYGPGIGMLKMDSEVGNRVDEAVKNGVKIVACETTMKGMHLTKADMLASAGYVPGGVLEIMKREKEGYAYIRP